MHRSPMKRFGGGAALVMLLAVVAAPGATDVAATDVPSADGTATTGQADLSEIVIGQVGAQTGPLASNLHSQQIALDAWVQWTNEHGGISGHPVRLVTADSKSDPTAEAAAFQQLNESDHPVAFVGVGTFNLAGAQAYLEEQQIPVVGGQISDVIFEASPVMFSEGTSSQVLAYAMASFAEGHKFGSVYCTESAGCQQSFDNLNAVMDAAGTEMAYSQKISLAEPDYTATCLAAKDAGVEYLTVSFNTPNIIRFAEQCAAQDFTPIYVWSALLVEDSVATSPAMTGAVAPQSNLPWFVSDGAGADFHAAMEQYAPDEPLTPSTVQGWASGELFKAAAEDALSTGELTSETLMASLRAMQDETLGGLAPPLNFSATAGPNPLHGCYFNITVKDGAWAMIDTDTVCAPDAVLTELAG